MIILYRYGFVYCPKCGRHAWTRLGYDEYDSVITVRYVPSWPDKCDNNGMHAIAFDWWKTCFPLNIVPISLDMADGE